MSVGAAYRVILAELACVGLDAAGICAEAGVDPRVLHDDDASLGGAELARVLARAEDAANDPLLGLHMGERARGRGVLSYLARSQATVADGLEAFRRFAGARWENPDAVCIDPRGARTVVRLALGRDLPRHAAEYVVTRTVISLRRSGAAASEVGLPHPPGGATKEYERVLGCPVRFRRPETSIAIRTRDLDRPLRAANPDAAAALAAALSRPAVLPPTSASARLAAAVRDAIARGDRVDREALARTLGMSGKTLARRLAAEQRHFRDVVDEVRRAQSEQLVRQRGLDLGEVASRVGFADLTAFGKAFRRWFGVSPSAFRTRALG
ncbi:MAG: AraC family transcriptional regulator ligand-binding domain-containing protein [bacterium]|nr:AraC family transcriptional regulator ligand-binding domain-containing protein [bacterium]